ncbi:hypothetical protein QBC32DRAFT_214047 [Pseudoneurospora amorphoporcata]|uniref:Uncharacterized protein n=1 Tax=Pseudoneurospora amorphoporcata TaxID=241081 RepID=A0AAN6SFJ9_9PEZI|nr:hypothetical protein QBC32DRAFT_214047 [Pseudoneurospora amorphoporcata]
MPFTRTTTRRSRPRGNNQQPPTLRRENAEVIYETVSDQGHNVDLSSGVDHLLAAFDHLQTHDGQRHSANNATSGASQVAPAGHVVNGRRIEREPQLPLYTQNPGPQETTMEVSPSETLPTYEDASNGHGKG